MASLSARREDNFQKCFCPKRTFPSGFVKLGSEIPIYFWQKNGRLFVCFVCFVLFGIILAYFKQKLKHSAHRAGKDAFKGGGGSKANFFRGSNLSFGHNRCP